MTLFWHEMKRGRLALIVWSAAVSFLLGVSILIYPEMMTQMGDVGDMFSNMGAFTDAFGMGRVDFSEFGGYFAVEFGNTMGLAGGMFAAILGIAALADEERNHTAEFLLAHPVSRVQIVAQKLLAIVARLLAFNVAVFGVALIAMLAIGERANFGEVALVFLAYLSLQLEIALIAFGVSAFLRGGSVAIGIGASLGLYFANILANLTDDLKFLKYLTPYGYADATAIVSDGAICVKYLLPGLLFAVMGALVAFFQYNRKDIA